jgi:uncharacterized membrane protein YecN with MAPEG domain
MNKEYAMELPAISLLSVTPVYAALLGLLFIPFTARAGFYRVQSKIFIGDGDDPELLRRIRGQGNFIETVPIALILLIVMELSGAGSSWLNALGALLVFGRLTHYVAITELGPNSLRAVGMVSTLSVYLVSCGWILYNTL